MVAAGFSDLRASGKARPAELRHQGQIKVQTEEALRCFKAVYSTIFIPLWKNCRAL